MSLPSSPSSFSPPHTPFTAANTVSRNTHPLACPATTITPNLRIPERRRISRTRPDPLSVRLSSDIEPRHRAQTTANAHQTLRRPESLPLAKPSSPIPIPPKQKGNSPPIVPLTARGSPPKFAFRDQPPYRSCSLTSRSKASSTYILDHPPDPGVPVIQRGFERMGPRPGSPLHNYMPTSPLSPPVPSQSSLSLGRRMDRRPPQKLSLAGLPRFHPAKFPSQDSKAPTSSPTTSRFISSQSRSGRGSDARQKLQQYQRDVIASATQGARSPAMDYSSIKPSIPRLTPLESPIDQMTPLVLEGHHDYFEAGAHSSPTDFKEGDGRDMVERLVRMENERRSHPEARSRSQSPALSPAVSPAGACR